MAPRSTSPSSSEGSESDSDHDTRTDDFDPTCNADGQILDLPMELVEMIASFLSSQEVGNARACNRQLAAYLDKAFFGRAHFHVFVGRKEDLEPFTKLAMSESAAKIKVLKFASPYLTDTCEINHEIGNGKLRTDKYENMSCQYAGPLL